MSPELNTYLFSNSLSFSNHFLTDFTLGWGFRPKQFSEVTYRNLFVDFFVERSVEWPIRTSVYSKEYNQATVGTLDPDALTKIIKNSGGLNAYSKFFKDIYLISSSKTL